MAEETEQWWTLWRNDRGEYRTVTIGTDGSLAAAMSSPHTGRMRIDRELPEGRWDYCATLNTDGETVMDIAQLAIGTCEMGVAAGLWSGETDFDETLDSDNAEPPQNVPPEAESTDGEE